MSGRFAFVFFATQWRPDLTWPLRVCLHSIDTRGGAAAGYPRYLIYPEEITPDIRAFCDRHRLIIQQERRFTYRLSYPNKALMLRVPQHDAICLTDLDIVFLADPTPMFERVAESGRVHTRHDLIIPLRPWPGLPAAWEKRLRYGVAPRLWWAQYRRFSRPGAQPPPPVPWPACGTIPPYFNDGVAFVPGTHARTLEDAWRYVSLRWLRDVALRRPYTHFFTNHFTSQISYSIALHRERIPWAVLPSTHNFIPSTEAPEEDLALLPGEEIVMAHMVSGVRHWLNPDAPPGCEERLLPLFRRVRETAREAGPENS